MATFVAGAWHARAYPHSTCEGWSVSVDLDWEETEWVDGEPITKTYPANEWGYSGDPLSGSWNDGKQSASGHVWARWNVNGTVHSGGSDWSMSRNSEKCDEVESKTERQCVDGQIELVTFERRNGGEWREIARERTEEECGQEYEYRESETCANGLVVITKEHRLLPDGEWVTYETIVTNRPCGEIPPECEIECPPPQPVECFVPLAGEVISITYEGREVSFTQMAWDNLRFYDGDLMDQQPTLEVRLASNQDGSIEDLLITVTPNTGHGYSTNCYIAWSSTWVTEPEPGNITLGNPSWVCPPILKPE